MAGGRGEHTQNAASTTERRRSISPLSDARRAQDNESNRSVSPLVRCWFVGPLPCPSVCLSLCLFDRLSAGDMRVESHNQKFNNGCTKGSTKRVDVHIFYEFYTQTQATDSCCIRRMHMLQAGRRTNRQTDG